MNNNYRVKIEEARDLLKKGHPKEAIEYFSKLTNEAKAPGEVFLYAAMTYDNVGNEEEAIPFYEEALNRGIENAKELRDCYVCLASSHRIEGNLFKSLAYLEQAKEKLPGDSVIAVFTALTLFDGKEFSKAVNELGNTLLDETENKELLNYERALREYFKSI
ncbi:tetratricopeptide repeat protein [Virgibacillus kekensis]|uniref:Tetratricopeptide repeat protein n=1 Tax=Virgibacillus kekensis TaxID=202261 RepID=A0ABV9DK67_9BACI